MWNSNKGVFCMKYEKSNKCSNGELGRRMCECDGKVLGEYPRYINSFYDFVIMTIDFHISALSLKYKKKAFELIGNIERKKIGKRYRGPLQYLLHELKLDIDEEEFDPDSNFGFDCEPEYDFNRFYSIVIQQ